MKVALVSNWNERCGVSEYARNLVEHSSGDVEYTIIARPWTADFVFAETEDADIVHFNYATYLFSNFSPDGWKRFRKRRNNVVFTFHDSDEVQARRIANLQWFTAVVVHEPMEIPTVSCIPFGIPLVTTSDVHLTRRIGTAGFPYPWKNMDQVAAVAKRFRHPCLAIAPQPDADTKVRLEGDTEVLDEWLDERDVIRLLASCVMNIFPYSNANYGISGAVRMGLAAKRPIVCTRCTQFRDLFSYEDEIYFVDDSLDSTVERVLSDIEQAREKLPNRVLRDYDWNVAAEKYWQVYSEVLCPAQRQQSVSMQA